MTFLYKYLVLYGINKCHIVPFYIYNDIYWLKKKKNVIV